jgi:hypothetical protein
MVVERLEEEGVAVVVRMRESNCRQQLMSGECSKKLSDGAIDL